MQIVTLVPHSAAEPVTVDLDYSRAVSQLAMADVWPEQEIELLQGDLPAEQNTLAKLVAHGTDREVRLAALLGSGVASDSPLGRALWRRAALDFKEDRCLASLLAPGAPSADALPLLAWIAADERRTLPVRAAAVARLLDADCLAVWPLARFMLLDGTAADETTEIANWPRKGRYELPKRVLLLSIQEMLARHQQPATNFEPNSAWQAQVVQVEQLDTMVLQCVSAPPVAVDQAPNTWRALHKLDKAGSDHAAASFVLFRHRAAKLLTD